MKTKEIKTVVIKSILLVLLSFYFIVVFGQSSADVIAFNANRDNDNIALQWQLSPENKLSTIVIERKTTDEGFKPIAEFWVNFEGNTEKNFRFTDKKIKVKAAQYRLKLINQAGEVKYSDEIVSDKESVTENNLPAETDVKDLNNKKVALETRQKDAAAGDYSVLLKLRLKEKEEENNYL